MKKWMPKEPAIEGDDAADGAQEMPSVTEDETPSEPTPPRHALDEASVNSKIIIVQVDGGSKAVIGTPDGAFFLPDGDIAHALPIGARIRKLAEGRYLAEQLNPAEDRPSYEALTATDAIDRFIPHFHPLGGS